VIVTIKPSKNEIYPELDLAFEFFYQITSNKAFLGIVPALNLQAAGENLDDLKTNITRNIQIEFNRFRRNDNLLAIIKTQWFENIEIETVPVNLTLYTFHELKEKKQMKEQKLTNQVTTFLHIDQESAFYMEKEMEQLLNVLTAYNPGSVLLIGEYSSGKSSLISEFARVKNQYGLNDKQIAETTASLLIQRLSEDSGWQDNLAKLCTELNTDKNILYVKNLADLFEVGKYIGNETSMAEYLKEYLTRNQIVMISECTPDEAHYIDLKAPGYLGLFHKILIEKKTEEVELRIIVLKIQQFAKSLNLEIEDTSIEELYRLHKRFSPYSGMPGKTIWALEALIINCKNANEKIDKDKIITTFCNDSGIPRFIIDRSIPMNVEQISNFFNRNIFGQEDAITTITDNIVSIRSELIRAGKPVASLLFVGPTGVGKTETAKVLAEFMFGNRNRMIRFDMSEFSDRFSVLRLTGDMSGHEGLLTSAVRRDPFSVILFDEIEKAHHSFFDFLLQVLGEGRLTDARGKTTDFCSTIIILTSNIGTTSLQLNPVGFVEPLNIADNVVEHYQKEVREFFRPELFNRIDRVIPFKPLDRQSILNIVHREILMFQKRDCFYLWKIKLTVNDDVYAYFAEKGYNLKYGARHLQRKLYEQFLVPLARFINAESTKNDLQINTSLDKELIIFENLNKTNLTKSKVQPPASSLASVITDFTKGNLSKSKIQPAFNISDVMDFFNSVTLCRRQTQCIHLTAVFNIFLSQMDLLDHELGRLKKAGKEPQFWSNKDNASRYKNLHELHEKMIQLTDGFQELELQLFNSFINKSLVADDEIILNLEFENLTTNLDLIKKEIVKVCYPQYNCCVLGIYGNSARLGQLYEIYVSFLRLMNFNYTLHYVVINKEFTTKQKKKREKEEEQKEEEQKNSMYIRKKTWAEIGSEEIITGYELEIKGDLSYLYFQDEPGFHVWYENEHSNFFITVANSPLSVYYTPEGIHRKDFFNKFISRREYYIDSGKSRLIDNKVKIDEGTTSFTPIITKLLQRNFQNKINTYFSLG
jgi:ATP-dependent Clp protease ATP-binding subunit ClpA